MSRALWLPALLVVLALCLAAPLRADHHEKGEGGARGESSSSSAADKAAAAAKERAAAAEAARAKAAAEREAAAAAAAEKVAAEQKEAAAAAEKAAAERKEAAAAAEKAAAEKKEAAAAAEEARRQAEERRKAAESPPALPSSNGGRHGNKEKASERVIPGTPPIARKGAPAVEQVSPDRVDFVSSQIVTKPVKLSGRNLDQVSGARVELKGRTTGAVRPIVEHGDGGRLTLKLSLQGIAPVSDGYRVILTGSGFELPVPLVIAVGAPEKRGEKPDAPISRIPDGGIDRGKAPGSGELLTIAYYGVRVVEESSDAPIAGASVCVGDAALPVRYGMRTTDSEGLAKFVGVPQDTPLRVRAAKQGYEGEDDGKEYSVDEDDIEEYGVVDIDTIELESGDGGATCPPTDTGDIEIEVANGAGAILCVGHPNDIDAYAAITLDPDGKADIDDVPLNTPISVLVDKADYDRITDTFFMIDDDLEKDYTLVAGDNPGQIYIEGGACKQQVFEMPDFDPIEIPGGGEPDFAVQLGYVYQHPRCTNCHNTPAPTTGNGAAHTAADFDDAGWQDATNCQGCHNAGNGFAGNWHRAPAEMKLAGKNWQSICAQLNDPAQTGGRDGPALVAHIASDPLVIWSWNPGGGREPAPYSHSVFLADMDAWVEAGMPCP